MVELEEIEKRKIVPVAAKISAGKSKLLNVLFNIKYLECKSGIATKFVNILRYNPNITQPCFYHLILKKVGENYIFYKDKSIFYEGEENIIKANKAINDKLCKENLIYYEDLFYITEINTKPSIKDENYLLTHDLCDIPGLSEYQDNTHKENNEQGEEFNEKNEEESEQIDKDLKEMGLVTELKKEIKKVEITENEKDKKEAMEEEIKEDEDDIFNDINKSNDNKTYLSEIFKIIKNYIDGAIIILSVDNYKSKDNYYIIAKLHKVIQKEIKNFLVILNKIDLSEDPDKDANECKGLFAKYFPKFKTFNINLNTFIPISVNQLENELLMSKNFDNLIYFHFYNYMTKLNKYRGQNNNIHLTNTFIDHLKDLIKKKKKITKNDIETRVNAINSSPDISSINEKIISLINSLYKDFKDRGINIGITEQNIRNDTVCDEEDSDSENEDDNNYLDDINPSFVIKYLYSLYKEGKNELVNPPLSVQTNNLLNYFQINNYKTRLSYNQKDEKELNDYSMTNSKIIDSLKEISNALSSKFKIDVKIINSLIEEIKNAIELLKIYNSIFIPFLGEINSGKSTIINGIIGEDVLPTGLKECTKRGIIIAYTDKEMNIRKANFRAKKIMNKTNYYFDVKNEKVIGVGLNEVREVLKGLNYRFNEKEEDSFYFIKTKIKLFDELGLDDSLKRMIYLIDLPGFGTENIFEKEIYLKLMTICDSFIFTVRNSAIQQNNQKAILDKIFAQAKTEKKILSSYFMKLSLFIFNNDANQTTTEEDIEKAKKEIYNLIGIKNNINLCFFNALLYSLYNNNYNYYYNLENTLEKEYKNYLKNKSDIYIYPEIKRYDSFSRYLINIIENKNDSLFGSKKSDIQKSDKDIETSLLSMFQILGVDSKDISKYKDRICRCFSFGKEKIKQLETKKESNYDKFKELFKTLIENNNNKRKEQLGEKIKSIVDKIDSFFLNNSLNKKNNEELKKFNDKKINIIKNMNSILVDGQNGYFNIIEDYKDYIKGLLEKKKDNIKRILKGKNIVEVIKEINDQIENNMEELNNNIVGLLNKISASIYKIIIDANEYINKVIGLEIYSVKMPKFIDFFSEEIGGKDIDLTKEIYDEMKIASFTIKKIYKEKGFNKWLQSKFSKIDFLSNTFDIMISTFLRKMEYILVLLVAKLTDYFSELFSKIENAYELATVIFTNEQIKLLEDLSLQYQQNRQKIITMCVKNNILYIKE
jgi:hypothetical protein